jgi:ABC-2 type transport system permease protein
VSARSTVQALPTLLRIGFAEALAYRTEMLVWILSTTMPLVMLALWSAVAREAPVGRLGQGELVAYFLAMFVVRQLTGSWSVWLINMEVREGTLALRLLRPIHPLVSYAASSFAEIPVRGLLAIPVAGTALVVLAGDHLSRDPAIWAIWVLAILGGWLVTLLVNFAIGFLALLVESSTKIMDVWLAAYFVFSGYLIPVELFPPWLRRAVEVMPFRYQLGLPVELMTGAHDRGAALVLLGRQWVVVLVAGLVVAVVWRRGIRRFAAYGG